LALDRLHLVYLIAGIPLVLATAPLLVELLTVTLAAMLPASKPKRTAQSLKLPVLGRLIVLVPSHNEELAIGRCVKSIAVSAGKADDILVIAHNCKDGTAKNARTAGAMVSVLNNPDLRGKGNALDHGFRMAFEDLGADAVLVIDADSTVSANLIATVRQQLEHASVLQCRYECASAANNPKSRLRALAFFCMNVVRPKGRHRLGLSCGIFGNGFAFRREVLERVPYSAHSIVEDMEFHLSLIAAGIRCEFVEEARVWAEVPMTGGAETTQSARWEGGRARMFRSHAPSLFMQVLRGRIALLEPLFDLAGLPLAMEVVGLLAILLLPIHILRLYAISGIGILALHLFYAIGSGPDTLADLRALAQVPVYVVSKIGMLPAIFRMTRSRAAWVRTARTDAPEATVTRSTP
jgi:cellulose synthase/poly-beta-1,6-N-acetylglucosamine synthase-like glycosyltransferase